MRPALALLWTIMAVLLVLAPLLTDSTADYAAYNPEVDGTRHLYTFTLDEGVLPTLEHDGSQVIINHGPIRDLDPDTAALLVLAPSRTYSPGEADHLREFLQRGGRALIADTQGTARFLIEHLDLGVRLPGIGIYTPAYAKDPAFPIVRSTATIPGLPATLILNRPSIVEGQGAAVITTDAFTWRDENANLRPDLGEERGTWAVARLLTIGDGELLVLGDPNLLTREMADANPGAAPALISWLTRGGRTLIVDEGHRATADAVDSARRLSTGLPVVWAWTAGLAATATVLATAYGLRLKRIAQPRPATPMRPPTPTEAAALRELE